MTDVIVCAQPVKKEYFFALLDENDVDADDLPPAYVGVVEMDCGECGNAVEISELQLAYIKRNPTAMIRCFICEIFILSTDPDHAIEAINEQLEYLMPIDAFEAADKEG